MFYVNYLEVNITYFRNVFKKTWEKYRTKNNFKNEKSA